MDIATYRLNWPIQWNLYRVVNLLSGSLAYAWKPIKFSQGAVYLYTDTNMSCMFITDRVQENWNLAKGCTPWTEYCPPVILSSFPLVLLSSCPPVLLSSCPPVLYLTILMGTGMTGTGGEGLLLSLAGTLLWLYTPIPYWPVQYSTVQYSTIQYSPVQSNTVQSSPVQSSLTQYSPVQYILLNNGLLTLNFSALPSS